MKWFYNFIKCGLLGWGFEILFTSLSSLRRRDWKLTGQSSLWMFPIYGSACILAPLSRLIGNLSVWFRGIVYAILIFLVEFFSGKFLTKHGLCPWNYAKSKWHIHDVIRLDYFPCWFVVGLIYEKVLNASSGSPSPAGRDASLPH